MKSQSRKPCPDVINHGAVQFYGDCQLTGAGLLDYGEGPVYRIRARRWFNGRASLPDYSEGPVYQKGRFTGL